MTNQELYVFISFVLINGILFLGVTWIVTEGITSKSYRKSRFAFLNNYREKVQRYLLDPKTRYKCLFFFLAPWWVLSECYAYSIDLGFQNLMAQDKYFSMAVFVTVTAKLIAQLLSFLVAAILVKLFIDKVDRSNSN